MERVSNWLKRRSDTNVVTYSRFGLPGDEVDERPIPTKIYVAAFDDDSIEFRFCGTHSTRAALVSAGVGMSATMFIFFIFFFEFDWYEHGKGVDFGALVGLFLFLAIGMTTHWQIVRGLKMNDPRGMVPAIMIYAFILVLEILSFFLMLNHIVSTTYFAKFQHDTKALIVITLMFLTLIAIQCAMLISITKARNYLEKKANHNLEVQVAEHGKRQNMGMEIIYVGKFDNVSPRTDLDLDSISISNPAPPSNSNHSSETRSSPPDSTSPPPRVILAANDDIS